MAVLLISLVEDRLDLAAEITRQFPDDSRKITPTQWLISANTTPQGLSEMLMLMDGKFGRVMVTPVTGYYGWHEKDLWDWLKLKGV